MRRAQRVDRIEARRSPQGRARARLRAVAVAAAVLVARDALAGNTLRGSAAGAPGATLVPSAAAAAQASAATNDPALRRAFDAIRAWQAAQDAARAQAAASSLVRNGLGSGGLEISTDDPIVGASAPEQTTPTEVTIKQSAQRAILTWKRFDVGSATEVHFDQTAGNGDAPSWVALNRVMDPNAAPSRILGSIRAEGQVYLINRAGVLFGGGSQVNVATLLVSGLDLAGQTVAARNDRFLNGALTSLTFAGPGGGVALEAGAKIEIAPYGRAVLLGGAVSNRGTVEAPDGQVLMAAGESIALQPPSDLAAVRGLGIPLVTGAGVVENGGVVSTPRGNITLVGAETWQNGLLTATTGAEQAGSIRLGGDGFATRLGAGSVTQVLPDVGGKKVIGDGVYKPSTIQLRGERIELLGGSGIYAPAGDVALSAVMTADPTGSGVDVSRVYVAAGARIDVSGLRDVEVPMSRNTIQAELRANELRDNPVVRNDPAIRGRTVTFDARRGATGGFAELSGYYDLVERDVTEVMTSGGSVTLAAADVIARAGSVIDLSGGNLRYLAGEVTSSILVERSGRLVRIEDAVAGVPYVGLLGDAVVSHDRWGAPETFASPLGRPRPRWEPGYDQGGPAGALHLSANDALWFTPDPQQRPPPSPSATGRVRVLDGEILASTVIGPKQREQWTGTSDPTRTWRELPRRAVLDLQRAGDVVIADVGPQLPAGFRPDSEPAADLRYRHVVPARLFDGRTFGELAISAGFDSDEAPQNAAEFPAQTNRAPGGHLAIGQGVLVDLGDYGKLTFVGKGATVDGTVSAPGGAVSLEALQTGGGAGPSTTVLVTGRLDLAGRVSNDRFFGAGEPLRALNGGTISIAAGTLELAAGSLLDVSGGERIDATGKATAGNGGSITLDVARNVVPGLPGRLPPDGRMELAGLLRGYAPGAGGALSVSTPDALLVSATPQAQAAANVKYVAPEFFRRGGFASYRLLGERGVTIAAGTEVVAGTERLVPATGGPGLPTGTLLAEVAAHALPPDALQGPMTVSLTTVPSRTIQDTNGPSVAGDLTIESGAALRLPPGSTVALGAIGVLRIDGTVEAPAGAISVAAQDKGLRNLVGPARVELGPDARLLAPGVEAQRLVSGSWRRTVLPGGSVSVSTPWDLEIDERARIDASGRSGAADLLSGGESGRPNPWVAVPVDGSAGSIAISASTGVVLGDLRLSAGGPGGLSGSLTVRGGGPLGVRQGAAGTAAAPLTVVADAVNVSGAGDLTLQVMNPADPSYTNVKAVLFQGDVSLRTSRSITLLTPILGTPAGAAPAHVTLSSGYVQLHGAATGLASTADAADLGSTLTVQAGLIDLSGQLVLGCAAGSGACPYGGFGTARLVAQGDLRLSDHDAAGRASSAPRLVSTGALELVASQVYVAPREQSVAAGTLERDDADPGFLVQSAQRIAVSRPENGYRNPVPRSFGERLTMRAPIVDQGGVVRAPLGQIRLEATGTDGSVTLRPGSVTSSSLEGALVPFGSVLTGGVFYGYDRPGQAPSKSVRLTGAHVAIDAGAVVDVTGGGDLLGYQFVPGNGGSRDVLATPNAFAVLPSLGAAPAPIAGVDVLRDSTLRVGDAVWLQGVPGLPAGYYTPLPAHYALLPGGLLVLPKGGSYATAPATELQADGSVSVAGARKLSGTPGFGRYVVMSRSVFAASSQYVAYSFTDCSSALAEQAGVPVRTPADGGSVVLAAGTSLALQGTGRFGGGARGQGGTFDLAAPRIAVLSDGAAAPDGSYLALDAGALTAFGAASLFLGGTRSASTGTQAGTALSVTATDVYVATSATTPLSGQELLLAATGSLTVKDGSVLRAEGASLGAANALLVAGDGALLRLSTGGRAELARTGSGGAAGTLSVGAATLAGASLTLDGTHDVSLAPAATLSSTQFELASARINLGTPPPGTPGATLGTLALGAFPAGSDLLFRGYGSVAIYGDLALGSRDPSGLRTLKAVTFDTGLVQGYAGPNGATITADALALRNSGGGGAGTRRSGTLTLDVDALDLGPGQVQVAGYDFIQGLALAVAANGTGGLALGGSLALAADQVSTSSGASYTIDAAQDLSLFRASNATPLAPASLGGSLALLGGEVLIDTGIVLPSGSLSAAARSGALVLGDSAVLDVRGVQVALGDRTRSAPGGSIRLSAAGDLAIASQARLDVSGATGGGPAGSVSIAAGLDASVLGALSGAAAAGSRGGSFSLDAGTYGGGDLSGLNGALNAGGFGEARSLRLRQQDLVVGASERIAAHDVTLRSDAGRVVVAGELAAGGNAGGRIALQGDAGVTVQATALLDAHATDAGAASGRIALAADGGRIDVVPGSVLDLTGGRSGGGALTVRAGREGNDVAVDRIGGDMRGAREVAVQGVRGYATATVDAAVGGLMVSEATTWLQASAPGVEARLRAANANLPAILVAPAMLVTSDRDLTVATDLDLSPIGGAAGTPGWLGLVAARDVRVGALQPNGSYRGSVSDGFAGAARDAALRSGRSFSYRLEAGNDVVLQPGTIVRTGTGDVEIVAARDLSLVATPRLTDTPPVVYTAGRRADTPGYLGPPPGAILGEFPVDGGELRLSAGRDLLAPFATQSSSAWLFRYGATSWGALSTSGGDVTSSTVAEQGSWSVVFRNFEQGVGALGGGDVSVRAGRDVVQLGVFVPTTGYLTTPVGAVPAAGDLVVRGGGDLSVVAGRDLVGGQVLVGRGQATLVAGGTVRASELTFGMRTGPDTQAFGPPRGVGLLVGLMDATAELTAARDLYVEGAFDPMTQGQIQANLVNGTGSAHWSYSERATLTATSLGGTVTYETSPWASVDVTLAGKPDYRVRMGTGSGGAGGGTLNSRFSLAPPTLRLVALGGEVLVHDHFGNNSTLALAAAHLGQLELLGQSNVRLALGGLSMDGTAPDYWHGALLPFRTDPSGADLGQNKAVTLPPLHLGDPDPVLIRAARGSVCAQRSGACSFDTRSVPTSIAVLKPVDVQAGTDVVSGNWVWSNNESTDLGRLEAGRDVYAVSVRAGGAGSVRIEAGRDVVLNQDSGGAKGGQILGTGTGATSAQLAGPQFFVLAGASGGYDYDGFAAIYLDPANAHGVPRTYLPELRTYLATLGVTGTDAALVQAFDALPLPRRQVFLDRVYLEELKQTGIDYNDAASPRYHRYDRGYAAVATLFPGTASGRAAPGAGSVVLNAKPVETQASGDIDILAPYGRIAVGAEVVPANVDPAAGGVVTRRGGSIRMMADENIDLYTSRVFTLQGGDILMWTSNGSITAGAGSKTSVFQKPLAYTMSPEGVIAIDAFGLQTGAGIGVLDALLGSGDRPRSRLDLIAPRGEVNAGDAGIRVVGDLNIAAQVIVGVENIQVNGGQSSGVPKVEMPSLAVLTTASRVTQGATKDAGTFGGTEGRAAPVDLPSIITVEVVGYETEPGDTRDEKKERKKK